jgi:predicted nucleic acid-binding protein
MAWRLVRENVEPATIVMLSAEDYRLTLQRMAELGVSGGAIYDALIARAAHNAKAERLLTFNPDDFKRVWPEGAARVSAP